MRTAIARIGHQGGPDAPVVIDSLAVPGDGSGPRVFGSYLTENDSPRGAALAVLNATNRILGNRFFMR